MFRRLQQTAQLQLITALGLLSATFVLCFGIYRLFHGEPLPALIDLTIAAALCAPVVYALRTGKTERAGAALCVIDTACCILSGWAIGSVAVYWYPLVLITNFFIASARLATSANLVLVIALLAILWSVMPVISLVSLAVSGGLIIFFTYFFATRINVDRDVLEEIASLDALTGLPNRRSMESCLTEVIHRHRTRKPSFALVIIDIDRFKQVNDLFGHQAGDAVLVELATILKRQLRRKDKAFRFGGEEFVVLVEVDDIKDLALAAERIRSGVREALRTPDASMITVSAGAAMYAHEDSWQEWFSLADVALYQAKNRGRDRTAISDGTSDVGTAERLPRSNPTDTVLAPR